MNKQQEALKLALEALKELRMLGMNAQWHDSWLAKPNEAIAAIREALAEQPAQQQELVAWMYQNKSTHEVSFQKHMRSFVDHGAWYEVPLYSEPLANQEKTSGSPKPAKPEALQLADAMEYDLDWCDEAAAELRRMHDLLGKANALCRIRAEEIERLKAQPEQEPVAWRWTESNGQHWFDWRTDWTHHDRAKAMGFAIEYAYTSPPASKPLDAGEISRLWKRHTDEDGPHHNPYDDDGLGFARAIEAKHGIKENT